MGFLRLALLSPILLAQALWVIYRVARLPEAAGARTGHNGKGPPLRVLIAGDSSAAGVGVATQEEALAGQIARALSKDVAVFWQVVAKSGATASSTCEMIREPVGAFDVAVIALGVNDSKNGISEMAWRQNINALIDLLQRNTGVTHVYLSGLPPLGDFPLLPAPLRHILGKRAVRFDTILQEISASRPCATYIPMNMTMDASKMASDGFHPGTEVYAAWADLIAAQILRDRV